MLLAAPVAASAEDTAPAPDPARLKALVEKLVSFGTRHTLSSTTDPRRGIGAARNWGAAEFQRISKACGGCLTIERISDRFEGPRAPSGVIVQNVLAIQKGSDPDRVIMIAGHIDSRVSDPMNFTADAPGANDDGSGTALVLEAARLLSKDKHRATIVYALLSGEEQGLWGGKLLAAHAKEKGWQVAAMLNNDIVGGTRGTDGTVVADRVRVFSEGIRASEDLAAQLARRGIGGEDDGPSRALAKAAVRAAAANPAIGLDVLAVRRPDRFRRGGDHLPSLELGYPAIRFTVGIEDYDHQHQDLRTENGRKFGDTVDEMDFPYLARVTALNVALARELADAPAAPESVSIDGAVSSDTIVRWSPVKDAATYRVHWRRADRNDWSDSRVVPSDAANELILPAIIVDDNFFGVSAISADGHESLVTFGGLPPAK
ncbi:peptidase M28 [Sphingopyxis sp. H071]|nr:peptidase M28 [Sphingopyxis sp. H057]KTE55917.1 peptidase M28 [Sphingopyxis sp. H073]KTE57768.1 peptidase M28 [Sphingopyxis sp. H071]KTE61609.1 peptidase M28 [Sphingopyxis sp. H107]KTE65341.1 peptidase M28 [Sphingopyxis sp. H100]KTE73982.1 peptidase M28 [Sphingopyxis sp. H081]KTE83162.1 peptidase M28 [Sphingopyxis sp. H067]